MSSNSKQVINQLASCIAYPDAVSSYVLTLDNIFKKAGFQTNIFATHRHPQKPLKNLFSPENLYNQTTSPDTINILHYSIYDQTAEKFLNLRGKKILIYHNITPQHFFRGYNDQLADLCAKGRNFLSKFQGVDLAIALSDYSRKELINYGIPPKKILVLPYIQEPNQFLDTGHSSTNIPHISKLQLSDQNLLFVGKIAPHKKIEDLIKSFYLYQKYFQPNTHLHIAGLLGNDLYEDELRHLISQLEITQKVIFHGKTPNYLLEALYQSADAFITMSEHEGFCVPIIEAMSHQLPVIAFESSAIAGTLGSGGVQIPHKDPGLIAEAINSTLNDHSFREQVLEQQANELNRFNYYDLKSKVLSIIEGLQL